MIARKRGQLAALGIGLACGLACWGSLGSLGASAQGVTPQQEIDVSNDPTADADMETTEAKTDAVASVEDMASGIDPNSAPAADHETILSRVGSILQLQVRPRVLQCVSPRLGRFLVRQHPVSASTGRVNLRTGEITYQLNYEFEFSDRSELGVLHNAAPITVRGFSRTYPVVGVPFQTQRGTAPISLINAGGEVKLRLRRFKRMLLNPVEADQKRRQLQILMSLFDLRRRP